MTLKVTRAIYAVIRRCRDLPHWTTPQRSAARYVLTGSGLRLLIEADQPAWRVEDGEMRVSNVQTGTFSRPLGSTIGQHRHRPDLRVRTPQRPRRLWTPSAGLVEITARASADPTCMLGLWLGQRPGQHHHPGGSGVPPQPACDHVLRRIHRHHLQAHSHDNGVRQHPRTSAHREGSALQGQAHTWISGLARSRPGRAGHGAHPR